MYSGILTIVNYSDDQPADMITEPMALMIAQSQLVMRDAPTTGPIMKERPTDMPSRPNDDDDDDSCGDRRGQITR